MSDAIVQGCGEPKARPHGFFIACIAILYAAVRFALDFLREADATYAGLTPDHYSALLTLALGPRRRTQRV